MEIYSICGNRCDLCPAYKGNIDRYTAEAVSEGWEKFLEYECPPEKIACVGCKNKGNHPNDYCAIRDCAMDREMKNCALCGKMPCSHLLDNMEELDRLESTHAEIGPEEYDLYYKPYHNREVLENMKKQVHKE